MSSCLTERRALDSIDPSAFKSAMRRFASSVNVITSHCGGTLNGMTATAVCSVSSQPPSVLVVVNRGNRSHSLIGRSGVYIINVLSESQEELAVHFASGSDVPFSAVPYSLGVTKCPIIDACASYLECVVESRAEFGTHTIFIGRVVAAHEMAYAPLLYHDGKFNVLESRECAKDQFRDR